MKCKNSIEEYVRSLKASPILGRQVVFHNVLLTNPEMLHLSLLAHHEKWTTFWQGLTHVVIDEVHTYRGVMGSHMAWVRRMNRVCAHYGVSPILVFCSATVGNPSELTSKLSGLNVQAVTKNSAPHGRKHVIFINPEDGAIRTCPLPGIYSFTDIKKAIFSSETKPER